MKSMEQAFDLQYFGVEFIDPNATTEPESTPTEPTAEPEGQPQQEPSPESFTNIDPNTLPPELQSIYKSLQGDYTRKTQEVAPIRKFAEQTGLGAEELQQIVQEYNMFSNVLQNNPLQLVQRMFEQGMVTKEQAFKLLGGPPRKEPEFDLSDNPYIGDEHLEAYFTAKLNNVLSEKDKQYKQELDELKNWKKTKEQEDKQRQTQEFRSSIDKKFAELKKTYPDVDEKALWESAKQLTLPPEDAELALVKAYGGVEKFLEAQKKQWAKERVEDRIEDNNSVSPLTLGGITAVPGAKEAESFSELKHELLNYVKAKNKV